MLESLFTAAAGLSAQQEQLDAISNDLANVNTDGYKAERVAFNDLLYNQVDVAGSESTAGSGANAEIIGRTKAQGPLKETGNALDLAIEGPGYFQVTGPNGEPALTRDGAFSVDASGTIVTAGGSRVSPPIKLPAGAQPSELRVAVDGSVTIGDKKLGQIKLVTVTSPDHMSGLGSDLLAPNAESGQPHAIAGSRIHQFALEMSNTDLGTSMAKLVTTERAFQLDSTALTNASQMMSIANQLRPA
jgi:flagellar basal-body rod protein FlgG